jgi:hypothetical protein
MESTNVCQRLQGLETNQKGQQQMTTDDSVYFVDHQEHQMLFQNLRIWDLLACQREFILSNQHGVDFAGNRLHEMDNGHFAYYLTYHLPIEMVEPTIREDLNAIHDNIVTIVWVIGKKESYIAPCPDPAKWEQQGKDIFEEHAIAHLEGVSEQQVPRGY